MLEFIQLCFAPINLIFTAMLLSTLGYWLLFFVGAVGLDFLDFDVDAGGLDAVDGGLDAVEAGLDLDAGVDIDAVGDVQADGGVDLDAGAGDAAAHLSAASLFAFLMRFLQVGDVPLMVLVTALSGSAWAVSLLGNYYLNPGQSWLIAGLLLIPNLLITGFLTRLITYPARYLFKHGASGVAAPTRIVGARCQITTSKVTDSFGQAEIQQPNAAPITLNVRSRDQTRPLGKGDEALILERCESTGTYIVIPFNLEDN